MSVMSQAIIPLTQTQTKQFAKVVVSSDTQYILVSKNTKTSPKRITQKRVGNDLHINTEDSAETLILESYYTSDDISLVGVTDDSNYAHYVLNSTDAFGTEGYILGSKAFALTSPVLDPSSLLQKTTAIALGLGANIATYNYVNNKDDNLQLKSPIPPANHPPTDISLSANSLMENQDGMVIGRLTTQDPDQNDTHTYTLSDDRFEIVGGELKLKSGQKIDFATEPTIRLSITVNDAKGGTFTKDFTLTVRDDLNYPYNQSPPSLTLPPTPNGDVLHDAEFATKGFANYKNMHPAALVIGRDLGITADPAGSGDLVAWFDSSLGLTHGNAYPRASVEAPTRIYATAHGNTDALYAHRFSFYLPSEYKMDSTSDWITVGGFHGAPWIGPSRSGLMVVYDPATDTHYLRMGNDSSLLNIQDTAIKLDAWNDIVVYLDYNHQKDGGFIQLFMNTTGDETTGWKAIPINGSKQAYATDVISDIEGNGWYHDSSIGAATPRVGAYGDHKAKIYVKDHIVSKTIKGAMNDGWDGLIDGVPSADYLAATALENTTEPALSSVKIDVDPQRLEDDSDVLNATRGQYSWYNLEQSPEIASGSHYERFLWASIEPRDNEYRTWMIDQGLERAEQNQALFGFRVMSLMDSPDFPVLPDHIKSQEGTWIIKGATDNDIYVPDWNSEAFLSQWEELMVFLGNKYNNDPRLGWVDVGGYGNWGEWHLYPYENVYRDNQKQDISLSSAKRMIDAVQHNFPDKFVLLNTTGERRFDLDGKSLSAGNDASDWSNQLWQHALSLSDKVGIRNDSLGGGIDQGHGIKGLNDASAYAKSVGGIDPLERWKTAPFVSEWGPAIRPFTDANGDGKIDELDYDDVDGDGHVSSWERDAHGSFTKGETQVADYHISWLSSDNFSGNLQDYSPAQIVDFYDANRKAGYRYTISKVVGEIQAGEQSTLDITWKNLNVAPTYDDWQIVYEIKNAMGQTVAEKTSILDLQKVLPSQEMMSSEVFDTSHLEVGKYEFSVKVVHKGNYHAPMNLDLTDKNPDDSYRLFTFEIQDDLNFWLSRTDSGESLTDMHHASLSNQAVAIEESSRFSAAPFDDAGITSQQDFGVFDSMLAMGERSLKDLDIGNLITDLNSDNGLYLDFDENGVDKQTADARLNIDEQWLDTSKMESNDPNNSYVTSYDSSHLTHEMIINTHDIL